MGGYVEEGIMCYHNEMGKYPSCVSAVFDGIGAEEHGMCGECSAVAKMIYDAHRNTFKTIQKLIAEGNLNLNQLEALVEEALG